MPPILIGANSVTPVLPGPSDPLAILVPDPLRGMPAPVIMSVVIPGQPGAIPAVIQGPSYDVSPIRLSNGQYTFAGAKTTIVSK